MSIHHNHFEIQEMKTVYYLIIFSYQKSLNYL